MASDEKKQIFGIDLGTTYSAIAYINSFGGAEIIANSDNERITPSVVFFQEDGPPIVGKIAKESAKTDPERVVSFVKREMGTSFTKEIDGKKFTPETISSFILKRLTQDAKNVVGYDVKDVVITCPAYFSDAERKATRAAGEIAGLNVLQVIDEPVAAAMHYGMNKTEGCRNAIVYDLGGGTFDVTVVEVKNGNVRVVCSDGNHRLGGADWDNRIVDYFATEFAQASGCDKEAILSDIETLYDLRLQAEVAKQTLTRRDTAKVMISFDGNKERIELTREKFEELTKDLLDQTEVLTSKMLTLAAKKGVDKIQDFLLVGGSTRMPQVLTMVQAKFADKVETEPKPFDVDEAVAKGAAAFGNMKDIQVHVAETIKTLQEEAARNGAVKTTQELTDEAIQTVADDFTLDPENVASAVATECTTVASRSYGIRVSQAGNPVIFNMLKKQSPVPLEYERDFPVSQANAEKLPLAVFANNELENVAPLDVSEEVGTVVMDLPPGLPKGALIKIKFQLTREGVLDMDAVDMTHGTPVHASFEAKDGLTQEEIEALRTEFADLEIE